MLSKLKEVGSKIEENLDVAKLEKLFGEDYDRDERKHLKEVWDAI